MTTATEQGIRQRTRARWEALVSEFARSGQRRGAFCAERSITISSLDYWRRKLRKEREASPEPASATPGFIDLGSLTGSAGWTVELELGDGLVLRLQRQ